MAFKLLCVVLGVVLCVSYACATSVPMLPTFIETPAGYTKMRSTNASTLYSINLSSGTGKAGTAYTTAPLLVNLVGTRRQIGYDYAALLHNETSDTFEAFMTSMFKTAKEQEMIIKFSDWLWDSFLKPFTPDYFLEELEGMQQWYAEHPDVAGPTVGVSNVPAYQVATRFYTLANMPADTVNIISMLEQELEKGWPAWLKDIVNDIIKLLERLVHSCDAYGVWGSRTQDELLYSSRNLDYNSDTGINRHKLVIVYNIDDPAHGGRVPGGGYASIGFAFGLGALAGMSEAGLTTSEMNLDNSVVTFSGPPFPLRLRMVLEGGTDLQSAMSVWNATNNTNSFNFLIGSAPDALRLKERNAQRRAGVVVDATPDEDPGSAAFALETIMRFTAQFPANSTIERDATYNCSGAAAKACKKWTNETGIVSIGKPLPEAVWRTNHGLAPRVMATQEPLFNNTVFRYNLMHNLFSELQTAGDVVDDEVAVGIVATLGIKGVNYFTCDQPLLGDNVMSIAYAPGPRSTLRAASDAGHMYIAWESGSQSTWRPAACSPYVRVDLSPWLVRRA